MPQVNIRSLGRERLPPKWFAKDFPRHYAGCFTGHGVCDMLQPDQEHVVILLYKHDVWCAQHLPKVCAAVQVMEWCDMPGADMQRIVSKESAAQIHVCFMGQGLQPEALEQRRLKGDYAKVVAFRPTGGIMRPVMLCIYRHHVCTLHMNPRDWCTVRCTCHYYVEVELCIAVRSTGWAIMLLRSVACRLLHAGQLQATSS